MGMKFATGPGGSSGFSAAPGDISAAGTALCRAAGTCASSRTYTEVAGVGDYTEVAQAVAARVAVWNTALESWQGSLSSLGDAATGAATAITETDANLARAWGSSSAGGAR